MLAEPMDCTALLTSVGDELFSEVEKLYVKHGDLTDDALLALHSLFGSPFERALELLEQDCVVFLRINDGLRYIIQVRGISDSTYTLFPSINFCSCPAYLYNVIGTKTDVTCKHVLAAKICEIMSKGREVKISGKDLFTVLCKAAKLDTIEGKPLLSG